MIVPTKITNSFAPSWTANEYSSVCPFSHDSSYLLLIAVDRFLIFDGSGKFIKAPGIAASERPRWSSRDAGKLTFLRENRIVAYHVDLGIVDSYVFGAYVFLDDYGEADQQGDGRVIVGTRLDGTKEIFVLNTTTGAKGPIMPTDGALNNLILTPSHGILVNGRLLFDPETKMGQVRFHVDGHKTVTRYKGRDVLIITNNDDNGIYMVYLDTGEHVILLTLGWDEEHRDRDLAVHISAPADAEWCLVTTYAPNAPVQPSLAANAILKVALDGSGAEVLCSHNSESSSYTGQPKASVSRDGSRFVFASNSGAKYGPVDTFLALLPAPVAVPDLPKPTKPPVVWPGPPYAAKDRWWGQFWKWLGRLFWSRG